MRKLRKNWDSLRKKEICFIDIILRQDAASCRWDRSGLDGASLKRARGEGGYQGDTGSFPKSWASPRIMWVCCNMWKLLSSLLCSPVFHLNCNHIFPRVLKLVLGTSTDVCLFVCCVSFPEFHCFCCSDLEGLSVGMSKEKILHNRPNQDIESIDWMICWLKSIWDYLAIF